MMERKHFLLYEDMLMKKTSVLTAVFLFLFCNCLIVAQDDSDEDEEKYVLELALYGGLGIPSGGLTEWQTGQFEENPDVIDYAPEKGWDIGFDFGYFVTQKLVLGLNFNYTQFKIDAEKETNHKHRLFSPAIYGKYLFEGETNFVPYVKATIGMDWAKFDTHVDDYDDSREPRRVFREISYDPGLAYGLGLGLFYYTADYSGIYFEASYHNSMTDDKVATFDDFDYLMRENMGVIQINLGIRLLVSSEG